MHYLSNKPPGMCSCACYGFHPRGFCLDCSQREYLDIGEGKSDQKSQHVHDEGLEFEPIHRLLFGLKKDLFAALEKTFGVSFSYRPVARAEEMVKAVDSVDGQN